MLAPVILCGGTGSRLWPLSRRLYPKQFHAFGDDGTLLQATARRLAGLQQALPPLVLCHEEHRFLVAEQLRAIDVDARVYLETEGRNTAPAAALAALAYLGAGDDPLLLVLPADHVIENAAEFRRCVESARSYAEGGELVTFGVAPHAAETGYGYIRHAGPMEGGESGAAGALRLERFVEKPDADTAREYVASGEYLWNSGMFLFKASRFVEELERRRPEIVACCREALAGSRADLDFVRLDADALDRCPSDSIDYAVMEHLEGGVVVPLDAGWSDIGSWAGLAQVSAGDTAGNVTVGDVVLEEASNCYVHGGERLIAALGLDNVVIVDTADAVLVADKAHAQAVRGLVSRLAAAQRQEVEVHKEVLRPWGSYQGVDRGARFQVKRLVVKPGARLSLQRHARRAEHWVVVRGTARVRCGEKAFVLEENASTYIPVGAVHQLENVGDEPLEVVEVQTGSYFGEDDIERLEDVYGRS